MQALLLLACFTEIHGRVRDEVGGYHEGEEGDRGEKDEPTPAQGRDHRPGEEDAEIGADRPVEGEQDEGAASRF